MNIIKFNFDKAKAIDLRRAVSDRGKFSIDRNACGEKGIRGSYNAWNRLCATMTRLEDTIDHLNSMELGKCRHGRVAYDFYEFLNCAYVVIDCLKAVIHIYNLDKSIITNIENSKDVFGIKYGQDGYDSNFFEYIRSLCSVHPLCTSRRTEYLNGSSFHCCEFVAWTDQEYECSSMRNNADLIAHVYATNSDYPIDIKLYIKEFETYLEKWIDSIPIIIDLKNKYVDDIYEDLRKENIKKLEDFGGDCVKYIENLKVEYIRRVDDAQDYLLDKLVEVFKIKISDSGNQIKLEKYKNAIMLSLKFLHNSLQNMSFDGFENTGIKYSDRGIETELYIELASPFGGEFAKYRYEIEKLHHIALNSNSHIFDKEFARDLLENPKKEINKYVTFTNKESNEEAYVLVKIALYLESLTRKSIINKNIPNEIQYRESLLTQSEIDELQKEEPQKSVPGLNLNKLNVMLKENGGNI